MKTIVLFGHHELASDVYMHVDRMLRERQVTDIALAQTDWAIDAEMAHTLRQMGGELWYCGPCLTPPAKPGAGPAAWTPVQGDRFLLADSFEKLGPQVTTAVNEFLGKTRVSAL